MSASDPLQVIPGLADLGSFTRVLDFVGDRKKYTERIANLEEKTQECNEAVQRVVALNALGALQARVKRDRLAADEVLATANQDAEKVRSAAQEKADKAAAETSEAKDALRLHTETEAERLSQWEKGLERREEIVTAKKNSVELDVQRAKELKTAGQKMKDRYGAAVEKLKLITNEV